MTTRTPAARRKSLLASLFFAPPPAASVRALAREMDAVHNTPVSHDLVRADLIWMQETGLCRLQDDMAHITQRGIDVARQVAPWPGGDD